MLRRFFDKLTDINVEYYIYIHRVFGHYRSMLVVILADIKDSLVVVSHSPALSHTHIFSNVHHFSIYTYIYKIIGIFLIAFLLCHILHKHELFFISYAHALLEHFARTT